ncbi:MAG: hypothetical protein ACIRZE_08780, partial [Ligilactobacillus salivarius]
TIYYLLFWLKVKCYFIIKGKKTRKSPSIFCFKITVILQKTVFCPNSSVFQEKLAKIPTFYH